MSFEWNLHYSSHLGYVSIDDPLYRESVPSRDPRDHVAFAAGIGLAGVLFPWAISRPDEEVERFRRALQDFGLRSSTIVYAPLEDVLRPSWTRADGWSVISGHLDRSLPLAQRLDAPMLAVLAKADPDREIAAQEHALIDNLRRAGDRAAEAGLVIGLEHMIALPGMLLTGTDQTVDLFERVGHPAVKMIFDTGHVHDMDGDVLAAYRKARRHIGLLQLADMPGRVEPGAGILDFGELLGEAMVDGVADGLIDLEHGWSRRSAEVERRGIAMMRQIDSALRVNGSKA